MVTVSKTFNNYNNPATPGSFTSVVNAKSYIDKNFQSKNEAKKKKSEEKHEDRLVDNTVKNRMKINWDKTTSIPLVHFPRGLGGAPDFTFYEFLQTAKFPYYVGGPILAALFYAGIKKDNFQSAKAAKGVAKHIALGVGLYYAGAALAKSIVNTTTKLSRGINLNQPYIKAISTSTNQTGAFKKDTEYHKVTESADFTRTDLLYKKGQTPEEINAEYARIGKRFGIKEDARDVDSTVKPLLKKTIIMARAWQYALTAFFVTLGIGMANQPAWSKESGVGFKHTIKEGIFGKINPPNATKFIHERNKIKLKMVEKLRQKFIAKNPGKKETEIETLVNEIIKEKPIKGASPKLPKQNAFNTKLRAATKRKFLINDLKERLNCAKIAVYDYMLKPFGKSFKEFWLGHNKASSIAGKTVIVSTALATTMAMALIMNKTSARRHKIEPSDSGKTDEVKK